jgi:alanine dehydrogenase
MSLRKISGADADDFDDLRCSFCGGKPSENADLVEGTDAVICDECVAGCADLLRAQEPESQPISDNVDEASDGSGARVSRVFFRLLREADLGRLLPLDDLLELMADALRRFSAGQVAQPVRTVLPVGSHGQLFGMMPAYIPGLLTFGTKLVSVVPSNAGTRVPTHLATLLLFTPETGALVAVVDGQYITAYRTAAVSAVSADLLAREESGVLAIIGSGVQARSHLEAMDRVFELSETRVWSPTPEHQEQFVDDMKTVTASRLVGSPSAADAVRGADLVVIATSASEPVVQNDWVKAGAHVISVGACRPTERELDPALVRRGRLFVDSRAAALVESGDIVMGIQDGQLRPSHIIGELGEVIAGKVEGRRSPRDVTIFKSLGLAVEDVMAADLAYRRAVEQGVGSDHEL